MSTKSRPWWDYRTNASSKNIKNRPGPPAQHPPRPASSPFKDIDITLTAKEKLEIAQDVISAAVPAAPDLGKALQERPPRTATRPRRETYAEHADRLVGLFRAFVTPVKER